MRAEAGTGLGGRATIDARPQARRRSRGRSRFTTYLVGSLLVAGFVMLVLWSYIFVTILPGHVGVRYSWLLGGTRLTSVVQEGLAMKMPWDRIYVIETRYQRRDERVAALTSEGMKVEVDISAIYRVRPVQAARVLQEIGLDYEERVVRPTAVGAVREAVSRYMSQELYTSDYGRLTADIYEIINSSEHAELIDFDKLIIRELVLPQSVVKSIDEKLAQEQAAAAYTFRLERERQEANRRQIEAVGIRNFYSIVSSALNPNLLTWRGIEATVELASSPNSKVVVVGSGEGQMPIILGGEMSSVPPAQPVPPISPENVSTESWQTLPNLYPSKSGTSGVGRGAFGTDGDPEHDGPAEKGPETAGGATAAGQRKVASVEQDPPAAAESADTGLRGSVGSEGLSPSADEAPGAWHLFPWSSEQGSAAGDPPAGAAPRPGGAP